MGAEIERLDALRREHQSRYEQEQRLADTWDDWNALHGVEQQLGALAPIDDFPPGGVSRLEALEERIRLARQYHDSAQRDVEGSRNGAEAQIENEAIGAHAEAIRGIERGRTFFDGAVHDLPERQSELAEHERERCKSHCDTSGRTGTNHASIHLTCRWWFKMRYTATSSA